MDPRYDRYRPDVSREHRSADSRDQDRRSEYSSHSFEPRSRYPNAPMGGPIDFDRRTEHGEIHMDHARQVADRLMSSTLVPGRRLDVRNRSSDPPLPSPPPRTGQSARPAPYDSDRPNRHEYRPVLQNLPKMKKTFMQKLPWHKRIVYLLLLGAEWRSGFTSGYLLFRFLPKSGFRLSQILLPSRNWIKAKFKFR